MNQLKNFLAIFKKYWLKLAFVMAWVNTRIILTILYFIIFPLFAIPYKIVLFFTSRKAKTSNWQIYDREVDLKEQF